MIYRSTTLLLAVLCASFALSCVYVKEEVSAEKAASAIEEATQAETQMDLPEFVSGEHPSDENQPHPGEALYRADCASCHDKPFYKAPSRMFISALGPQNHLNVMN
jgi:cytochrome c5